MKKIIKVFGIIFIICGLLLISFIVYLTKNLKEYQNIEINTIELSTIEDGTYAGEFDGGRWKVLVNITVQNHQIIEIKVIDDMDIAIKEVKIKIINDVITNQSVNVEVVSGSTVSSKAYLKAIEDALDNK